MLFQLFDGLILAFYLFAKLVSLFGERIDLVLDFRILLLDSFVLALGLLLRLL